MAFSDKDDGQHELHTGMYVATPFTNSRRTGNTYQHWNGNANFGTYNEILNSSENGLQLQVTTRMNLKNIIN